MDIILDCKVSSVSGQRRPTWVSLPLANSVVWVKPAAKSNGRKTPMVKFDFFRLFVCIYSNSRTCVGERWSRGGLEVTGFTIWVYKLEPILILLHIEPILDQLLSNLCYFQYIFLSFRWIIGLLMKAISQNKLP